MDRVFVRTNLACRPPWAVSWPLDWSCVSRTPGICRTCEGKIEDMEYLVADWHDSRRSVVRKTVQRWTSAEHWRQRKLVSRGFELPAVPTTPASVWGISMVKNEADIIDSVVRHMLDQDIDRILIVDNGSTDGTYEMLKELSRELPISVGRDREPGYYQAHKMTALASRARRAGAEWVVPFDADEFWFAPGTTVGAYLRSSGVTRVQAAIHNAFPTAENPRLSGLEGELRLDVPPHLMRKVASRTSPFLWIGMGNHTAMRSGSGLEDRLRILHLPWRSQEQLTRKVRQGAAAYAASSLKGVGGHWITQGALSDDGLQEVWDRLLKGEGEADLGWRPIGPFLVDRFDHWRTWDPDGQVPVLASANKF